MMLGDVLPEAFITQLESLENYIAPKSKAEYVNGNPMKMAG
jgi:hypothetical protein